MKQSNINFKLLLTSAIIVTLLFIVGLQRLKLDFDIVSSLPQNNQVIKDASYIFKNHPMHDQILIDVQIVETNQDILIQVGDMVETQLRQSNLFTDIGIEKNKELIIGLISYSVKNLPYLFSTKELNEKITPMLKPKAIEKRLKAIYSTLIDINAIGQSQFISKDPLNIKNLVLARMMGLSPVQGAVMYKGKLLSSDKKHLLIMAKPKISGTDTSFARSMVQLVNKIQNNIDTKFQGTKKIILTPMGAYRSALDNELIVRKDVNKAVIFATIGIAFLLLLVFPRPWIGLLSLLPAIAGTMIAFFVYSLFYNSISIMVLGFGGAVISITVDHGIAYLLFLDRSHATKGKDASKEIWAVGLISMLTTMGAFLSLCISGFPVLAQLGQFTALGILFSFLFIHSIFPKIFPSISPAPVKKNSILQRVVDKLTSFGNTGALTALIFICIMLFFAKPEFYINLSSMNTVSSETKNAEKLFTSVWGDIFSRIHIMIEAENLEELQNKGDIVLKIANRDMDSKVLIDGFLPEMLFPGTKLKQGNFDAWKNFWSPEKISKLKKKLMEHGEPIGFTTDAFNPFLNAISNKLYKKNAALITPAYFNLMGISENKANVSWVQSSSFIPDKKYNSKIFFEKYSKYAKVFDPNFFSETLGNLLFSTFMKMLILISISVIILLLLFFMDFKLTFIAILPVTFALIATLGTLKIINHPLDIPALMLSIIVMGMGIDYSLFFVRSYQRYGNFNHKSFVIVKMAVFMASISTIIGFGILCTAEHALLKSAGITSFFGIGYSIIGTFLILPPLLTNYYGNIKKKPRKIKDIQKRVRERYRYMEAYPRLFARFKIKLDPMFKEFEDILNFSKDIESVIDIGTGYGVPGCWLLEKYPKLIIYGLEPNETRVKIAKKAMGKRGIIKEGKAPFLDDISISQIKNQKVNVAVAFDMLHYLTDNEFYLTLEKLFEKLDKNGRLIIRVTVQSKNKKSWVWYMENFKLKMQRVNVFYRSVEKTENFIKTAGFKILRVIPSGSNDELIWIDAIKHDLA